MSMYPADQRCPRCQYPITPGATACPNCGLALSGPPPGQYGSAPLMPPPPPPTNPYGPSGTGSTYGGSGYSSAGSYDYTVQSPGYSGSPSYYPGSQPQPGGFPGSAPPYPGSQPQPGGFAPPGVIQPPVQQQRGSGLKIGLIILAVLVVLGGVGGLAAYLLTRPKPTIDVTSEYKVGTIPAGAASTVFHVTGEQFSSRSAITFLLDGNPAPDTQTVQSDSNGNIRVDVTVSAKWAVGDHTLSARDASNYTAEQGQAIKIVNQGEAHTPGPNGAPPDDNSFVINFTVHAQDAVTGESFKPFDDSLTITGQPDPAGGKVCNPRYDDGAEHIIPGEDSNGNKYNHTYIWSCSGTYKGGKLTYTETATKSVVVFEDGFTCTAQTPYIYEKLEGTFTGPNSISGTFSADAITYNCSDGKPQQIHAEKGTWEGTIS